MIPGMITGRLSYVDIAWPWGLFSIGVITLVFGDGTPWRKNIVGTIFLFIGGRMGLGALKFYSMGVFNKEFPRYDYRKLVWKAHGVTQTWFEL